MNIAVLTVRQPWATLLAHGIKKYETRSWRTIYRGPIAIHASKTFDAESRHWALQTPEVCKLIAECGYRNANELPLGGVLAIGTLTQRRWTHQIVDTISPTERLLGDWSSGRWAWRLDDMRLLKAPVWLSGCPGIWHTELPDHLLEVQS
jgi:hypothetical protein